ncbi:MAG: glycosyltransferase family 4 protein [Candidatus Omnitrophota bacterium]
MKILFCSYAFYPSVGGIESAAELLAAGFAKKGHEVKLVTAALADKEDKNFPFEVIRRPHPAKLLSLVSWSNIVFHNNISLNLAWPLLFIRRPWAIIHQTWFRKPNGAIGLNNYFKRFAIKFATNIAVSQAVADDLGVSCEIILHPYDDSIFYQRKEIARQKELAFVGRLVTDKGVDILLRALKLLAECGQTPHLTIIGDGPEKNNLQKLVKDLSLERQVVFSGVKKGSELAEFLNEHKILVVPSLWNEPSGGVAMEAIACGCVVVGSQGGGLAVSIGPCGTTFPNGDKKALADRLRELLSDDKLLASYRENAAAHLAQHTVDATTERYLAIFRKISKQ